MSADTHPRLRPITGRHVLFAMLGFFGVIIVANLVMVAFALQSRTGLVVPNSYVASQDFNRDLARARAQQAMGWRMAAALADGALTVRLTGPDGAPLDGLTVTAILGRPVTDREDRRLVLTGAAGVYRAPVSPGGGVWQADIRAEAADGRAYRRIWRLLVEPKG